MVKNNIKKFKYYCLIIVIGALMGILFFMNQSDLDIEKPVEKTLRFTYALKNTSDNFIENTEFSALIPLEIPGAQHIVSITTAEKYELITEAARSQAIKFKIYNLAPFATKIVNLTIVMSIDSVAKKESIHKKDFLVSEKFIEKDNQNVKKIAAKIADKNPKNFAKNAYEWLIDNIKDAGYVAENKGAQYALEKLIGDCTEHMYSFVALARANNVPARGIAGFVVKGSASILNSADYHNWAEFYDDGKWILVDSQKRVFDQDYENYIIVRFIGGDKDSNVSSSRFLTSDQRLQINL